VIIRPHVLFAYIVKFHLHAVQILVATPGRLRDHIENTAGFATRLMGVKVLVLDEADHLLDMGFRKVIERIISAVPKQRQTLMFSATVPEEVCLFLPFYFMVVSCLENIEVFSLFWY